MKRVWSKVGRWCLWPTKHGDWSRLSPRCRDILRVSRNSGQPGLPQHTWWRPLLGGGLFPWSSGTWPTVTKGSVTQTRNQPKVKTSIRVCHLFANFLFMTFLFLKSILSCCVRCARWRNCSVSKGHPWCWLARLDWCHIVIPHRESSASGKGKIFIDLLP